MQDTIKFEAIDLPNGIRSRFVNGVNGLKMHILEAGFEDCEETAELARLAFFMDSMED